MKKTRTPITLTAMLISGVAIACATLPMPVPRVNVSIWNLIVQTFTGQTNPAQAAFLSNLDSAGEEAVGAEAWRTNNYVGEVLVTTRVGGMNGGNLQFVDKPCGKKALDLLPATTTSSGGGGGGGGGFSSSNYNGSYYRPIYRNYVITTTIDGVTTTSTGLALVGYELVSQPQISRHNHAN